MQLSHMANIYENAYVTIAATSSRDGNGGCYRHSLFAGSEKRIGYSPSGRWIFRLFTSTTQQPNLHFHPGADITDSQEMDEFPLFSRTWALQERYLSPRILQKCSRELVFECRHKSQCQCGRKSLKAGSKSSVSDLELPINNRRRQRPNQAWWAFVIRYTRLHLTFDKDLLPALSGVTRRLAATQPEDKYLAGIWKVGLLNSLMWFVRIDNRQATIWRRARDPRAPSWSWASVVAPISWHFPHWQENERSLAEIKHASCTPMSDDIYGRVKGGLLRAIGPVVAITLTWEKHQDSAHPDKGVPTIHSPELTVKYGYAMYPDIPFYSKEESPLLCLALFLRPSTGLVLRPLKGKEKYERVGIVRCPFADKNARLLGWLEKMP